MARRINVEELTRKINELRVNSQNKSYTNTELSDILRDLGFNRVVSGYLMGTFPYEKIGSQKLYSFPKEPIHKSVLYGIYNKLNGMARKSYNKAKQIVETANSEELALKLLQSKGYQVRKCIGFDEERFKQENPSLYKKYLKYETV